MCGGVKQCSTWSLSRPSNNPQFSRDNKIPLKSAISQHYLDLDYWTMCVQTAPVSSLFRCLHIHIHEPRAKVTKHWKNIDLSSHHICTSVSLHQTRNVCHSFVMAFIILSVHGELTSQLEMTMTRYNLEPGLVSQ